MCRRNEGGDAGGDASRRVVTLLPFFCRLARSISAGAVECSLQHLCGIFSRSFASLYRCTEGSEKGCGSFFLVHSFWVVMCSSGFVSFFPQKMSYLQSCVGCTCVLLSLIGKVFRQQQLLWPYCCCCAGRLLVLREGNEQRVLNRINQDECEQQLLVQYWV